MIVLQQLINGLQLGSVYALIALGYSMVYGIILLLNFAHGDIIMVGGYIALLIIAAGISPLVAVIASVAGCTVLACLSIVASGTLAYFTAQETAHNVITTVTFDAAKMDNIYQNCTAKIEVQAHAVQVANNGDTVLDATGWPA